MQIYNFLLFVCIFIVLGDAITRTDDALEPFVNDDQFRVAIKLQESPELNMLSDKQLMQNDSILRVMVLGDSYIMGPGNQRRSPVCTTAKAKISRQHNGLPI